MKMTGLRLLGSTTIDLPLVGINYNTRYILKNYDGLGPSDNVVSMADYPEGGSNFQNQRPLNKNPVIRIGLNPAYAANETYADLRSELHGLLRTGKSTPISIQIMNGATVVAVCSAWVEKFEQPMFTREPEVQISFKTDSPYLHGPSDVELLPVRLTGNAITVTNVGTAPAGFKLVLEPGGNIGTLFALSRKSTIWEFYLYGDMAMGATDLLTIDTRAGLRQVTWKDGAVNKDLIHIMTAESQWITLEPGVNTLWAYPYGNFFWNSLIYRPQYWGV